MGVTFEHDDGVGSITLDHPPANSYDLEVMSEFGAAVDEAIESGARAVIVRSASEKFFSAGADVKKFLAGRRRANMEMIARQPGGVPADGGRRRRCSSRTSAATPWAADWRSRWRATSGWQRPGTTSSARPRSRWGCCPATAARSG